MDLPALVDSALGPEESVATRVPLGGEDALFVTDRRTLVYRAEGLLSDESIEEYGHDAERVTVSEGRRKSSVTLDYGLDGERTLKLPADRLDDALHYVVAGVLDAAGLLNDGEDVTHVFRFSDLSLVITTERVVKHIGAPVWDEDFETYAYDDVTDLTFEDGSVATSVVLRLGDRQERFKAPNEQARAVKEGLTDALLDYHGVESLEELRITRQAEEDPEEADPAEDAFGGGPDPLTADLSEGSGGDGGGAAGPGGVSDGQAGTGAPAADADGSSGDVPAAQARSTDAGGQATGDAGQPGEGSFQGSGFEPAEGAADGSDVADLAEEVAALREAVDAQAEQLQRQQQTIETLIEELRRGR
jgi:hypothetical protein